MTPAEEELTQLLYDTCDCTKFQPRQFDAMKKVVTQDPWRIPSGGGCAGSIRFGDLMLDVLAHQKDKTAELSLAYFVQTDRIHADHVISPAICYRKAEQKPIASAKELQTMTYDAFLEKTIAQVASVVAKRESFREPATMDTGFWKIVDLANRPTNTKVTEQEAQKELMQTMKTFLEKCRSVGLSRAELNRVLKGASSNLLQDSEHR